MGGLTYIGRESFFGSYDKQELIADGVAYEFPLNYKVGTPNQLLVMYDGVIQEPGPGKAYTISNGGQNILFSFVPPTGSQLYVIFLGQQLAVARTAGLEPIYETATGDGFQTVFTLANGPVNLAALIVFINGIQKRPTVDFTVSGNDVTFLVAPGSGDAIDFYIHGVERSDIISVSDNSITTSKIVNGAVTNEKISLQFLNYSPSISVFGGMSYSNLIVHSAKYIKLGSLVKVHLHFSLDLAGSPDQRIRYSLPFQNNGDPNAAASVTLSTSSLLETGLCQWGSVNAFDVYRKIGENFTLTNWDVKIKTEYETI